MIKAYLQTKKRSALCIALVVLAVGMELVLSDVPLDTIQYAAVLATVIIFNLLYIWNEYPFASIMIEKPAYYTISRGIAAFQGQYNIDYGGLAAYSVMVLLPELVFSRLPPFTMIGLFAFGVGSAVGAGVGDASPPFCASPLSPLSSVVPSSAFGVGEGVAVASSVFSFSLIVTNSANTYAFCPK